MSSVEQKIREVLDKFENAILAEEVVGYIDLEATDQATQAILQIIESDVIGEEEPKAIKGNCTGYKLRGARNQLRAEQRANLREDK